MAIKDLTGIIALKFDLWSSRTGSNLKFILQSAPATGGVITTDGLYTVHTFLSDGTFTPAKAGDVDVLIVAGGGGGGYHDGAGGAGGGGGVIYDTTHAVTVQAYSIVVGAGGLGATSSGHGNQGGNSSFDGLTAIGGGYGAGGGGSAAAGGPGGSGGSGCYGAGVGGDADYISPRQGYDGGTGAAQSGAHGSGGGGGASEVGDIGTTSYGGNGGDGLPFDIVQEGVDVYYGGGGGGGSQGGSYANSTGGLGGGGRGNGVSGDATNGTANTGGGAGGETNSHAGRNGGSGIVVIRYLTSSQASSFDITPNVTTPNTKQTITWDISAIADADKNAIANFIVEVVNADADNIFYLDNFETTTISATVVQLTPQLSWSAFQKQQLNPALQWSTMGVQQLTPSLEWKASMGAQFVPNLVNYPFVFDTPSVRTSDTPILVSGCPIGFTLSLKNTGSSGQTTVKIYAGGTLRATKTLVATGLAGTYIEYFTVDDVMHPTETFSVEVTEVATGATELKVDAYLMTFPYKLDKLFYENYFGTKLIKGIDSNYLFLSADYWTIEFNQPISSIISAKAIVNGTEVPLTYVIENGIYYNNRLKITPTTDLPISLRIIIQDLKLDKHVLDLTPTFKTYVVDVPEYVAATVDSSTYGSDLATGGTAAASTEVSGYEAAKAFDNNAATYWKSTAALAYLSYSFLATKQIERITINPFIVSSHSTVKRWILSGSNEVTPVITDDTDWTYVTGDILTDSTGVQTFDFDNPTSYLHYRLTVLDNYASTSYAGIYEVEMLEKTTVMETEKPLFSFIPLNYYQYSFDGGATWSVLDAFTSSFVTIDFTGQTSGIKTIIVRCYQSSSYFDETFTVVYSAELLACSAVFDGTAFKFYYTDDIPFANIKIYKDTELYSTVAPTMIDGFAAPAFSGLTALNVAAGTLYYQGEIYSFTAASLSITSFVTRDGKIVIAFGLNTSTGVLELQSRKITEQFLDFVPIIEGTVMVINGAIFIVEEEAALIFEPTSYTLNLTEDAEFIITFEDMSGRTRSFNFSYIQTYYNVWRTLVVTDSLGNTILPGQIHAETSLTYTVITDEESQ